MNSKIFSLFVFSIFLLSGISAVVSDGYFISNNAHSIIINYGDATSFNVDFSSAYPPVTININVYNSQNNLIYSFPDRIINSNGKSLVYLINQGIYQNPGTYTIEIISSDSKSTFPDYLTLTVNSISGNAAPIAKNKNIITNQNIPITITLSATDADNDILTYFIATNPSHGVLSNFDSSTGQVTYTPDFGFSGLDSFTFKANDGTRDSNIAMVLITVKPITPQNPQITIISPEQGKEYSIDKTISLRVTTNSVVSEVVFRLDEGNNIEMDNPSLNVFTYSLKIDNEGTHFITFYPTDNSGNLIGFGETVSFSVEKQNKEEHVSIYPVIIGGNENRYSSQFQPSNNYITGAPTKNQISSNLVFILIIALEIALVIILTAFIVFVLRK